MKMEKTSSFKIALKQYITQARIISVFAVLLFIAGCGGEKPPRPGIAPHAPATQRAYRVNGHWYAPIPDAAGFTQKGTASWYGPSFHGKKTANGEIYNMHAMTAAHKTLPLGTVVSVRNLRNGRKIVVRINDRGPFVRGRIIDLSNAAAKKIGMIAEGTAPVEIKALETISKNGRATRPVPDLDKGNFTVQVGAFADRLRAMRVKAGLEKEYRTVSVTTFVKNGTTFHRVRAGRFSSLVRARNAEFSLVNNGFPNAFTVSVDN